MELKSLIIGLIFTIGIFALKSGVGLHYYFVQKRSIKTRFFFFFGYALVYLLIFLVCAHILQKLDMIRYLEKVQGLIKSGMLIHILTAGGLSVWGTMLLKQSSFSQKKSYGWLALIIPCPVCMTVIFFTTAFLIAGFPDFGYLSIIGAYLVFLAINLLTVASLTIFRAHTDSTPESTIGSAMLLIAGYFFLCVIIMPQFADIGKIYRMATCHERNISINASNTALLIAMISFMAIGFLAKKRKIQSIRRTSNWT